MCLPYRGGNWNNGSNVGPFALNLNNERTNTNRNIGFRAALAPAYARSLLVKACRTELRGKREPLPPSCERGKHQRPPHGK